MSEFKTFTLELDSDGILLMTIDVPNQGMNVWDEHLISEFPHFVDRLINDDDVKGAVICSGRDNAFLAGADLRMLEKNTGELNKDAFQGLINEVVEAGTTVEAAKAWVKANPATLQPWDVRGFKVPGGAGAMNPKALQFFMAANAMAVKESKNNYPAIKAIMSCLYEGTNVPMDTAIAIEVKYFCTLLADPVAKNMIRTLFVNKQAAEKGAARPEGIPPVEIKKVGVLGAGLMGSGIAYVTAKAGMQVISLDRTMEDAQKSVAYAKERQDKQLKRGRRTQEQVDEFMARITPTDNYDDLKDVDLIIEAVFERPDVKAQVVVSAQVSMIMTRTANALVYGKA